ncbi:ABC transporter [Bacillus cereus]|uniref:ABC transporter n=1 Tax=Bacillus cereus TaxID=1396 RepID=UPI001F0A9673|nr:ABC transporter [Bacillus cereus]
MYINLVGMVLFSLFEGIAIFLLIPMLSISGILNVDAEVIRIPGVTEFLQNFKLSLPLILGIYVFLIIGQIFLQRSVTIRNVKLQMRFINYLRLELYEALLQANWLFFVRKTQVRFNEFINK